MKNLTDREKKLVLATLGVLVLGAVMGMKNYTRKQLSRYQSELTGIQQQIAERTANLQAMKPAVVWNKKITLALLKNLVHPIAGDSVKIAQIRKLGFDSYRVELQGEFRNIMRFVSFLQRHNGDFRVQRGDLGRVIARGGGRNQPAETEEDWLIQAVFYLSAKGHLTS